MTYFGFLVRFLVVPIVILLLLHLWDRRRGMKYPPTLRGWSPFGVLGILIVIALLYTTPWDNYLVATGVWWYDPARVAGITLGWVPLEEYLFFLLQPIMVGLWALLLARRLPRVQPISGSAAGSVTLRTGIILTVVWLWIVSVAILIAEWQPGKYLGLELAWALPPIILQLSFGLDTLIQHRRLVLLTIIPATLYLAVTDSLAIASGIWTIQPAQSLGVMLGQLPVEEFVFFLLTTMLVTFGLVLGMAAKSRSDVRLLLLSRGRDTHTLLS
ncbi:MAG: lycopene cyclase domain-containing protein [Chloroflexota bacterium]